MNITPVDTTLNNIYKTAERNQVINPSDYYDEDGILRCGVCKERKQTIELFGGARRPVPCSCRRAELDREAEKDRQTKVLEGKARCFSHDSLWNDTFANDNGKQPKMTIGRKYVDHWQEAKEENLGLLLFGGVGTGKTYCACAIANALCEQLVPVKFANLSEILNELQQNQDKNAFIRYLTNFSFLIIDDFGIQRGTEYATEQVFNIIDNRYRSRKPLIVTSNLTLDELKNPKDTARARVYDRVLEMCQPVFFDGESMRTEARAKKRKSLTEILSEES